MARSKFGLPGIYNSVAIVLDEGEGAALALDSSGRLILGTSTASIGVVDTELMAAAALADAAAANPTTPSVGAIPLLMNATTVDRQRAVVNALNSVGTGIEAAGLVAQLDDTSPTAITENSFGNVRMSPTRALYGEPGPFILGRVTADGQIKGSAGFIHTISFAPTTATPTAGLITIYDSTTETGTVIFSEWIFAITPGHTITLDLPAATGIFVGYDAAVTNVSVTVSYR